MRETQVGPEETPTQTRLPSPSLSAIAYHTQVPDGVESARDRSSRPASIGPLVPLRAKPPHSTRRSRSVAGRAQGPRRRRPRAVTPGEGVGDRNAQGGAAALDGLGQGYGARGGGKLWDGGGVGGV